MLKSVFESELLDGMHKSLIKQANNQNLDNVDQAVDYLNSAIDILESQGLTSKADQVLNILYKIAKPKTPKKPHSIPNGHTKNLTSKKMVENLKHHGTPFNMNDLSFDDDGRDLTVEAPTEYSREELEEEFGIDFDEIFDEITFEDE
jgi:hypothetical protein